MDKLFAPDACAAGPRGLPSVPLSPRLRLPLCRVVSEHYRSPPADKRAGRATADASGPGGIVARRREFRGLRPGRRERQAVAVARILRTKKKRSPPPGGLLDQKRLSCTICGASAAGDSDVLAGSAFMRRLSQTA